jgi:hypothetical protein
MAGPEIRRRVLACRPGVFAGYVGDGQGGATNDRVIKFDKNGKFITAWGKHGKSSGRRQQPNRTAERHRASLAAALMRPRRLRAGQPLA